jgi:hypothetical protein
MQYRPYTVDLLATSAGVGSSLLDDAALTSSLGFAGNVMQNGATIRVTSAAFAFLVRPLGFVLTASAFLQFCEQGVMIYGGGLFVPATTTMRLAKPNSGGYHPLVSTSGSGSQISSDGRCFTAHAVISNITAAMDVAAVEIEFSSPLANRSLVACSDVSQAQLADGSCVSPQQDPGMLSYMPIFTNHSVEFLSPVALLGTRFVTAQDVTPPLFTYCPGDQAIVAPESALTVLVNWTLPTATDDAGLAGPPLLQGTTVSTTVSGNTVSRLFSVAQSTYVVEYVATDTSSNKKTCRCSCVCVCVCACVCVRVLMTLLIFFTHLFLNPKQVRDPDPDHDQSNQGSGADGAGGGYLHDFLCRQPRGPQSDVQPVPHG